MGNKLKNFIIFSRHCSRNVSVINPALFAEYFSKIDQALDKTYINIDFDDIDEQYDILSIANNLFDKYKLSDIYDLKFKMNVLSVAIIFSCLFIFASKNYDKPVFNDDVREFCFFVLDRILLNIKISLHKFGNPIFDTYDKICEKILYTKDYPLYISKREIYRALNARANNKDVYRAIQNLVDNRVLDEIEICLKKRKGRPCGAIYYRLSP